MIHARVSRNPENEIDGIHISITQDSLPNFQQLIHRALNCWDSAPKELKELGDMLTHGYITQDHTYVPINTTHNTDLYTTEEREIILKYIMIYGNEAWARRLKNNQVAAVLDGTAKD